MQKIPTVFVRDERDRSRVTDVVTPGCEWVAGGEGTATRKYDGTCCMVRGGRLFKRYELKKSGKAPPGFEPAGDVDETTGKVQGWVPVGDGPDDKWHREAWAVTKGITGFDGTYELLGPKIQGNPEQWPVHCLFLHNAARKFPDCPRTFAALRDWLAMRDIEGVVWHHPDGRMAKIKKRDFGLKRKP